MDNAIAQGLQLEEQGLQLDASTDGVWPMVVCRDHLRGSVWLERQPLIAAYSLPLAAHGLAAHHAATLQGAHAPQIAALQLAACADNGRDTRRRRRAQRRLQMAVGNLSPSSAFLACTTAVRATRPAE
ncbi:hypothetical protein WOLCODRAFT_147263 [Wolfiporia cocos MD-104 SS10]|uniref:Uncharacterized protein n=1 Tax=Wolfiporia cocos (strain MD-104) TaxID=742152 RepID=A0A2H3J041_WOLCO|nr:hypothetical protein WOLCODRAFT_147263 [Wolfiporia cocos MD-104 SS10]